jgi:murein DD-endopeptidase MepM/ murein hydrolase activator NlpD
VLGTHALTIRNKDFPEEHLSVSSKYVEPPAEVQERLARERAEVSKVYRMRTDRIQVGGAFVRPVPGEPTSIFGTRRLFNGKPRSPHPGLDLRAATGTTVKAAGAGVVGIAQDLYYSGNTVIIDHGGGLFTIYAHLSEIDVSAGDEVAAGAVIGKSGATGRVTGPHLHWGAKIGDRPFDPTALLDPALF